MKISELLKDKAVSIKRITETKPVVQRVYGGLFGGFVKKIYNENWTGYAIVKNGNRILEIIVRHGGVAEYSLIINGEKQSADKETLSDIFEDIHKLYTQQEEEKERIKAEKARIEKEKARAVMEKKKQVYYNKLQESLLQK